MTTTNAPRPTTTQSETTSADPPVSWRLGGLVVALLSTGVALAAVHVLQGNAAVGVVELWDWAQGGSSDKSAAVVIDSRIPRLLAGCVVGMALGTAGCVMQSISRNVLASPDTLAVNAGAHLAITIGAIVGVQGLLVGQLGLAFLGGLAGAALVLALAGTEYGTVRLVLAGTVTGLVLASVTTTLLILNPFEARGIHAWVAGSLAQNGLGTLRRMAPIVAAGIAVLLMLGRRLDIMMLGDDEARSLGVPVRRTQLLVLVVSVLVATASVTIAGPVGFVGLVAPALVRLIVPRVPGLHRHTVLIPVSGLAGVVVALGADVGLRAIIGTQRAVEVPTGIMTSMLGAVLLIVFAFRLRASRIGSAAEALDVRRVRTTHPVVLVTILTALLAVVASAALLIGDRTLLLGDLALWLSGDAGPLVTQVLDARAPRVAAGLLAGVALSVAGVAIQGVSRNALADPRIIGVSGGASVGAVVVVTFAPTAGFWTLAGSAGLGALVTAALIFGLAARNGFATDRLVLVGVGMAYLSAATVTLLVVTTDPFNAAKALTWLSGSTYGRSFAHLMPLAIALAVTFPVVALGHRQLDLLSIEEDLPRVLGVRVVRARVVLLVAAVVLTAAAVAAIGVVGFVGLVAPHAARTLVGRRHAWVLPTAALVGACLVMLSDLIGRTVAAPTQLPVDLMVAIIGGPYFFYLLHQSRARV